MTIFQTRATLFLLGCIFSRLLLATAVANVDPYYLQYIGYAGIALGLAFIYLYIFGNRYADAQLAWTGESQIWWSDLRLVHGLLYLASGYFAITGSQTLAWRTLAFDVCFGLAAWTYHHYLSS